MSTPGREKVVKAAGSQPSELELTIASELFNLEATAADLKGDIHDLVITSAKELEVDSGRKAIVVFVPYRQLKDYHKIQVRLVRELEKKFSGKHIVFVAQRTILAPSAARSKKHQGPRPRSRTLTAVQESILEDIVYPTEIVGKRIRHKLDGGKLLKVYLDPKDVKDVETKLDTFAKVYSSLTNKDVVFEFPVENP